jgi:hypothetical protein
MKDHIRRIILHKIYAICLRKSLSPYSYDKILKFLTILCVVLIKSRKDMPNKYFMVRDRKPNESHF